MPRFTALFDLDGWPLATLHADQPFLCVTRYTTTYLDRTVAYTQHRTARAALRQARRNHGIAVEFNGLTGRWEPCDHDAKMMLLAEAWAADDRNNGR